MAASRFWLYNSAVEYLNNGTANVVDAGGNLRAMFLASTYTPSTASHSVIGQLSGDEITNTAYARVSLAGVTWQGAGTGVLTLDANDFDVSTTAAMQVKYIAIYDSSATVGGSEVVLCFCDTETTSTTGVESTQITVQFNANGIFQATPNS